MRSPVLQLLLFRFREFYRDPAILFWALIFPLLMMLVLGVAFRPKPPGPVTVLVAVDPGDAAAEAAAKTIAASPDLEVRPRPSAEAALALTRGEAPLLVIPGNPTPVYRYDPTHPEARATRLLVDAALAKGRGLPAIEARREENPAPGARYIDWFVPGILGMQIMNGALWGVGFALVEMRAKRLLKRFAVTPMRRSHFLLATSILRYGVVALEAILLLFFSRLAFGVELRGSVLAFGVVTTLGTFAFAGLALLVASRAKNVEAAMGLMNLVTLPMLVLSGVFFSSARFPGWLQPFIKLLPLTALLDSLRRVTNEGAGLGQCLVEVGILSAWMVVSLAIALRIFRWT